MSPTIPKPITTGDAMSLARRHAGLTQSALAEAMGMTPVSISRLETGRTPLTPRAGYHLALLFAWLGQQAPDGAIVPTSSAPHSRSTKFAPNEIVTRWCTLDGARITREDALALPAGTRLWSMHATGREPVEGLDQWEPIERTSHPSQPFISV